MNQQGEMNAILGVTKESAGEIKNENYGLERTPLESVYI